jgi:electron transfer flavoprotein alpha subunit
MANNEIWVLTEKRAGKPTRASLGLLAATSGLCADKNLSVIGMDCQGPLDDASVLGAQIEARGTPVAVLAPAGSFAQDLLPRLAARLKAGYVSQCVDLFWDGDHLAARRPVYGGRAYEEVVVETTPALMTVRTGALGASGQPGAAETVELAAGPGRLVETGRETSATGSHPLGEATRVVAGGRGMGEAGNFKLLEDLAAVLDGAVGASRSVVDSGWRPHDDQVGKSGKTISPELYIACGISGAIHHVLGMNTAKTVVAINTDPQALIFQNADYGLVGDAMQLVPKLTEVLKDRMSGT